MSPSDTVRGPAHTPRRRVLPLAVSLAVHLGVLAFWASMPESADDSDDEPLLRPIELVELDPPAVELPPQPVLPTEPVAPTEPDVQAPAEEPAEPTEPREPPPAAEPQTPRATDRPELPSGPATGPTTQAAEPDDKPDEAGGGIALFGLREGSRRSQPSGSLRPQLSPPPVGSGQVVRQTGGAHVTGPAPLDSAPRSLAEAGFVRKRSGKMVYFDRTSGFKATLLPDGRMKFRTTATPSSLPGGAEVIRAAQGQELFQAQKKRLLEQTFDLRLAMAVDFARDKIDRRLKGLYRDLLDLWGKSGKSAAERRAMLFERWDECEEGISVGLPGFDSGASSELDDVRSAAGQKARETIERFVRRQLPAGSPDAFTAEELRRFNAKRHSQARFAPY